MLLTSVFPAQAGTQTLSLRREAAHWIPALGGNVAERLVDEHPPLPTLSPSRGEMSFFHPRHCERSEATQKTDTNLN